MIGIVAAAYAVALWAVWRIVRAASIADARGDEPGWLEPDLSRPCIRPPPRNPSERAHAGSEHGFCCPECEQAREAIRSGRA